LVEFHNPRGVAPRTYISPQLNDVNQIMDASDQINLLGVGEGAGGRTFERLMLRRRSMIAAVGFDL